MEEQAEPRSVSKRFENSMAIFCPKIVFFDDRPRTDGFRVLFLKTPREHFLSKTFLFMIHPGGRGFLDFVLESSITKVCDKRMLSHKLWMIAGGANIFEKCTKICFYKKWCYHATPKIEGWRDVFILKNSTAMFCVKMVVCVSLRCGEGVYAFFVADCTLTTEKIIFKYIKTRTRTFLTICAKWNSKSPHFELQKSLFGSVLYRTWRKTSAQNWATWHFWNTALPYWAP